jgi:mannitol 2-dehydrogenase
VVSFRLWINSGMVSIIQTPLNVVRFPKYNRASIRPGVVHLGLRRFHRVHDAVFFDSLLHRPSNAGWGIISVGTTDSHQKAVAEMRVQNSLYSVISKTTDGLSDIQVVGSILDVLQAPTDNQRVIELISSNDTKMISLTIKEGNFFFNDTFTRLDLDNPQIHYDLVAAIVPSKPPRTPVGMMVAGLYKRYKNKGKPITVLCTDNLARGGDVTRTMVESFAVGRYPMDTGFHQWLQANVFYPNSVCDRICLTDPLPDMISLQELTGVRDKALLTTESFSSWVIEKWLGEKPEGMDEVGIKFVGSTVPYENLKKRLNYGTRLAVATVANSLGYSRFEDAMGDPMVLKFTKSYMNEAQRGLGDLPKDIDVEKYKIDLINRISTKELRYMTDRVLEDTSKKVRLDWLPVIESLPQGAPTSTLGLTIAVWCHLMSASHLVLNHDFHPVVDANYDTIHKLAVSTIEGFQGPAGDKVVACFLANVFGDKFVDKNDLNKSIRLSLKLLQTHGIRAAIDNICR